MDEFGQTLTTYLNNRKDKDGKQKGLDSNEVVKVAIIDDGVYPDRDGIGDHIAEGETFYDNEGHWPGHYQSTYGHGHLMACLIKRLCPKARLYIAKLNELWRDGRSQITTESAAEVRRNPLYYSSSSAKLLPLRPSAGRQTRRSTSSP